MTSGLEQRRQAAELQIAYEVQQKAAKKKQELQNAVKAAEAKLKKAKTAEDIAAAEEELRLARLALE